MIPKATLYSIFASGCLIANAAAVFNKKDKEADRRLPKHITEASGTMVSAAKSGFLWVLNDSGGGNELHLIESDGTSRGSVMVSGAKNIDWEDLAGYSCDGKNYLIVADIGDNNSKRKSCTLYVVQEPNLPANGKNLHGKIPLVRKIDFKWEGGPKDCEAVAVDPSSDTILLVSKRTVPPEVHVLPLQPTDKNPTTKKIGTMNVMAPGLSFVRLLSQPTGMDISSDWNRAVLLTYYGLFVFERKRQESWHDVFKSKSLNSIPHGLKQAEAVALSKNGKQVFALSEGKNAGFLMLDEVEQSTE